MIKHPSRMRVPLDEFAESKRRKAAEYDEGKKGFLTEAEIGKLYSEEAPLSAAISPRTMAEALDFLGVTPTLRTYYLGQQDDYLNWMAATAWRGNFHIAGVGAGHAKTGRRFEGSTEYFVIDLVLDLFGTDFLIDNIQDARVYIGAMWTCAGASEYWPTFVARDKVFWNVRGYIYSEVYPSQIQLAIPLSSVVAHAGTSGGIAFYASIVLHGQTYWINRDGQPYLNFDVPSSDLGPPGSP